MKIPLKPVKPNSIEVTPPRIPATTPIGIPKLSPQPDCTIGTRDKTKTENIPNLERTLSIESTNETPAIGAAIKRINKKTPMISRGIPILLIKLFFLVIYCLHFSTH